MKGYKKGIFQVFGILNGENTFFQEVLKKRSSFTQILYFFHFGGNSYQAPDISHVFTI